MSIQHKIFFLNNQNLFSQNYLEYRLPETDLWIEQKNKALLAYEAISNAYETIISLRPGKGEEAGLEDKFLRPVLKALGFEWDVQPITARGFRKKHPDYALFMDKLTLESARKERADSSRFYTYPLTILEAKYWGRHLNDRDPKETIDRHDPTAQIVKYLDDVYHLSASRIQWAILTNGKEWRLFYHRAVSRTGHFLEIDLEEVILKKNMDTFLYFYLFFSRDAFIPDPKTGQTWLEKHLLESEAYSVRVSTNLKNLIFDNIFEELARGFVDYRRTVLSFDRETEESKQEIFKGCLTLLYRLLFILYAESRNLLPLDNRGYHNVSFTKLKEDIYKVIQSNGIHTMSQRSYVYWARIESLFEIIAKGDSTLNVPAYNGGLFESNKNSFLAINKMSDPYLAAAIDKLTVDHESNYRLEALPFIDYSSLAVRHLGDIYEGLLEFRIEIANKEIVEIREKEKAIWVEISEIKLGAKIYRRKQNGDVYIENSKHERKATGSYYTPHYIVEDIVVNTIGTVLNERLKQAEILLDDLDSLYEKQRNQLKQSKEWKHWEHPRDPKGEHIIKINQIENDVFEVLFDFKVLDPAMGSGHFLVHSVDYISDRIITFLANYPDNPVIRKIDKLRQEILLSLKEQKVSINEIKLTEVNLIKRMVMKRCIYGIDLNEMAVELAKLSLWLDSFTLGAPLSFLDHHLKCGNSLIGVMDISNVILPGTEAYSKVLHVLSYMLQVSELTDATISDAKQSYDLFQKSVEIINPIKRRFDVVTAKHFMNDWHARIEQLAYSLDYETEPYQEIIEKCKKALQIARNNKYFHWRIEFPEVFFSKNKEKDNPGFDCIIGNPPYDVISELEQNKEVDTEKKYFKQNIIYEIAIGGKLNLYRLFIALSLCLLKKGGTHGFIVPMALLGDKQAKSIRNVILKKYCLMKIEAFPQKDDPLNRVFEEAKLSTCIYILRNEAPTHFSIRIHPGKDILKSSNELLLDPLQLEKFDKENISIPSYPNMTMKDFYLALKLKNNANGVMLEQFAPSQQGEVNLTSHSKFFTNSQNGKIILRGAHVNRYEFHSQPKQGDPIYLNIEKYLANHSKDSKAYDYNFIRIGYQRGSAIDNWRRIIATIIEKGNFCSDTINYIVNPKTYDLFAILALLNSTLWEWRFKLTSTNNHVNSYEIDSMPMPPICFNTPIGIRNSKVDEAINLFKRNEYNKVSLWTAKELSEKRYDTVHDIIAYLAEKMIEMHKLKNIEVEAFLKWIQREIGAEIEDLSNKTYIKEYYEQTFDQLLGTLRKNKNMISINLSDRKFQEILEKSFNESLSKLVPLKLKIKLTDILIDEIVYKLYSLTDDEIIIVKKPN